LVFFCSFCCTGDSVVVVVVVEVVVEVVVVGVVVVVAVFFLLERDVSVVVFGDVAVDAWVVVFVAPCPLPCVVALAFVVPCPCVVAPPCDELACVVVFGAGAACVVFGACAPCEVEPVCGELEWVVGFGAGAPCVVVGFGELPCCAAIGTVIINMEIADARKVLFMAADDRKPHTCADVAVTAGVDGTSARVCRVGPGRPLTKLEVLTRVCQVTICEGARQSVLRSPRAKLLGYELSRRPGGTEDAHDP
jgi:hypothetical protein